MSYFIRHANIIGKLANNAEIIFGGNGRSIKIFYFYGRLIREDYI